MRWCVLILAFVAAACSDIERIANLAYDERYGQRTELDLYLPSTPAPAPRPAILLIHGGGWRSYSKDSVRDHAVRLADIGYPVAAINYRLVPHGAYPRLIQDCFCALGWLQANAAEYGIDPERIATMGYSAGGHLAALIALAPATDDFAPDCGTAPLHPPVAVVSGAGPMDMRLFPDARAITEFLGGAEDEVPEVYERASPISHVRPDAPPFLFIHGSDDLIVSFRHTEVMAEALADFDVETRVLRLRGGGHLINPGGDLWDAVLPALVWNSPEAWMVIDDFFATHLELP